MTSIIIRLPEVKRHTGLSRSQIYALIAKKEFPPQIELGTHAVGWIEGDVQGWIAKKINSTRLKATPKQLRLNKGS